MESRTTRPSAPSCKSLGHFSWLTSFHDECWWRFFNYIKNMARDEVSHSFVDWSGLLRDSRIIGLFFRLDNTMNTERSLSPNWSSKYSLKISCFGSGFQTTTSFEVAASTWPPTPLCGPCHMAVWLASVSDPNYLHWNIAWHKQSVCMMTIPAQAYENWTSFLSSANH